MRNEKSSFLILTSRIFIHSLENRKKCEQKHAEQKHQGYFLFRITSKYRIMTNSNTYSCSCSNFNVYKCNEHMYFHAQMHYFRLIVYISITISVLTHLPYLQERSRKHILFFLKDTLMLGIDNQ